MARFNLRDVVQAISNENLAPGTYLTGDDGAEFTQFPSDANPPVLPTRNKVEDNAVGDGRAYPKQGKPYYFNPVNFPYAMALNSTMGMRVFRMWLGGTVAEVPNVVPGTIDYTIEQKNPGEVPMVANLIRDLGGEAFLFGDAFVQTIEISQQGAGEPRISSAFNNSGHFEKLSNTLIDLADVLPLPDYLKYHGAKTTLTFSDGVDSFDFASEGRLIDVAFTGNQNVVVDQLPGDSFQNSAAHCHGAYSDNFNIDIQSAEMRVKVFMDANFAQFASWLPDRKLSSVILTFHSCELIGLTTHYSQISVKFPVAEFNLEGDTQSNFSAYAFNIKAIEGDPTTGSLVIGGNRRATADVLDAP